jgi:hypothetical protein
VYISENKYVRLSITLSIRNSDLTKDLYIESIDYYNTEGKLVKQYLSQPHILKPMASMDYVVNLEDMSGGNGAKFLINTASKNKISNPIAQAIMINTLGKLVKQYLSQPHILKPMASMDYVVNLEDMSGGNGAKFLINTASKNKISNPIAQAIMINTLGNSNLSFVTQGYIIE